MKVNAQSVKRVDVTIQVTAEEWRIIEQHLALGREANANSATDADRFIWGLMNTVAGEIRSAEDDF